MVWCISVHDVDDLCTKTILKETLKTAVCGFL